MDDALKERLLRISNAEYDEEGRIKRFTALPGCLFSTTLHPSLDILDEYCASNYALCASSRELAVEFNLALKLCGHSTSSLYIGYGENGSAHFISPPCYFGKSALVIDKENTKNISKLQKHIANLRDDKKFQIMSEKYTYAMSSEIRMESRFIEAAIILEMILLPKSSLELSYRFSLRMARVMEKLFQVEINEGYENGKQIYKTRSNLVHSGADKNLDRVSLITLDYTRRLMCAYLEEKDSFSEENLDKICLGS